MNVPLINGPPAGLTRRAFHVVIKTSEVAEREEESELAAVEEVEITWSSMTNLGSCVNGISHR